eukprot:TRINITY_DN5418_c0_g2_i19.p1 TRINITY_DN5418_c0_g2~~TRINITY_DN5418_c0_g2_i19.p1  ORF type:complete len:165 (+),score=17.84 TRINITY_DN5418_c0_g2_i19:314-808(+)
MTKVEKVRADFSEVFQIVMSRDITMIQMYLQMLFMKASTEVRATHLTLLYYSIVRRDLQFQEILSEIIFETVQFLINMTTSRQPTSRDLGSLQNLWPYPRSIKFLVTFPPDDAKNLHPTYIKHVLIASQQSEILWQDMYYLKKIANFMKFCTDEDLIREWEVGD